MKLILGDKIIAKWKTGYYPTNTNILKKISRLFAENHLVLEFRLFVFLFFHDLL